MMTNEEECRFAWGCLAALVANIVAAMGEITTPASWHRQVVDQRRP
jgi:hypothetical protein